MEVVEETGFEPLPLYAPDFDLHWDLAGPHAEAQRNQSSNSILKLRSPGLCGLGEITVVPHDLSCLSDF